MYGFEGGDCQRLQLSISELSVVDPGGWAGWVGGRDKRTSWSDLSRGPTKMTCENQAK